jgi:hypothetical protein
MKLAALILVSAALLALAPAGALAQDSSPRQPDGPQQFNESGQTTVDGRTASYLIRRLPASSFPDLPNAIADVLDRRGCMIPQTFQAHRPENVVNASFQHPGSSDWAVLCSTHGNVDLLVFFAGAPGKPMMLASAPELQCVQRHDSSGVLGFDWGIGAATPQQVREAQAAMEHHPPLLDHDALEDTVLNQKTVYRFYAHSAWTVVDTSD